MARGNFRLLFEFIDLPDENKPGRQNSRQQQAMP
jgi:hypothetical protein